MKKTALTLGCVLGLTGCMSMVEPSALGRAAQGQGAERRQAVSANTDLKTWGVDGAALSYQDTGGDKPVVICLHAIGHASGDYAAVVAGLRGQYRVIALDWPGQGRSEAMAIAPEVSQNAELLHRFVGELELKRFDLIGNSVGGGAALLYASTHHDRVRSVVVANPAGLDSGGMLGGIFTWWMARRFDRAASDPAAFQAWFAGYYDDVLPMPMAANQRERIVASGLEAAPLLAQAWRGFSRPENDLRSRLPGLRAPVLITWAQRDEVVRWSRNREAIGGIPDHHVEFFDAGHTPMLEQPEQFLRVVVPFLAQARQAGPAP
jgi:4,5:9,10-diseco-3-hydroxy-5,9,17-trioxoandrosta-1(10),2-diene-4-oate hydrolase